MIDESTAMALVRSDREAARLAFWATGLSIFVCWNASVSIVLRILRSPHQMAGETAAQREKMSGWVAAMCREIRPPSDEPPMAVWSRSVRVR